MAWKVFNFRCVCCEDIFDATVDSNDVDDIPECPKASSDTTGFQHIVSRAATAFATYDVTGFGSNKRRQYMK